MSFMIFFSKKILHFSDDFNKLISVKTYEKSLDKIMLKTMV